MIYQKFLEHTIGMLIESYPFFGCLVQKCSINWTFAMPTAAVRCLPNGNLEMVINPEFFTQLTPKERVGLVLHEMFHLTSDHLSRSFGLDPQIANIAMDTAINQHIPIDYLPPGALLPENVVHLENRIRKQQGESEIKLEHMQVFENYYNILKAEFDRQHIQQMQNPHKFEGQLDANNQPQKPMTEEEKKEQKEQTKKMLEELLKQEKEMEEEKQKLLETKVALSDEEKNQLKDLIESQKILVKEQEEIHELLKKAQMNEVESLNEEVRINLSQGQENLEKELN